LPFSTSISSKYEGRAATNKERSDHRTNEWFFNFFVLCSYSATFNEFIVQNAFVFKILSHIRRRFVVNQIECLFIFFFHLCLPIQNVPLILSFLFESNFRFFAHTRSSRNCSTCLFKEDVLKENHHRDCFVVVMLWIIKRNNSITWELESAMSEKQELTDSKIRA
jgi:hypothetical protein